MSEDLNNMFDIFTSFKDNQIENIDLNIDTTNICKYCNMNSIIFEECTSYCSICGIQKNKQLSESIEYRYYGDSDNKSSNPERLGMPTNSLLPQSSLGSLISKKFTSISFKKMIQYNSWNSMPYKERSQLKVFTEISNRSKLYGIPNIIIEQAKVYYKIISENSISRGSNRNGLIAACIYMACRKENVPRSTKEIASIFKINIQDMTRGCKKFKEIFRLNDIQVINTTSSDPLDYIDRFCSNLNMSKEIRHICEFVAIKSLISSNNIVEDNTAPSIAAGSIFMVNTVLGNSISKKSVADACKISEVTISKCYKKLYLYRLELLPKNIINKYKLL